MDVNGYLKDNAGNAIGTSTTNPIYAYLIAGGAAVDHNTLANLQGGTTNNYYHLTATQNASVSAWDVATSSHNHTHNNLNTLQGGTTNEYYHLTSAQNASVAAWGHNTMTGLQGGTTSQYYHLTSTQNSSVSTWDVATLSHNHTHNNLTSLQGGTTSQYYHLTSTQQSSVSSWNVATAAHATQHKSTGFDVIKLDEFGWPTDNTTLNAAATCHGLLAKTAGSTLYYLDGTNTFNATIWGGTAATVGIRRQLRQDTQLNWMTQNPTLLSGCIGFETDTHRLKVGDGSTAYNSLGYPIRPAYNYVDGDPRKMTLTQDTERFVDIDDFSNNTLGQYTLTGNPTISSGVLTLATTEKAIKAINPASTTGKWAVVLAFTTTYSTDQSAKFYFGATSYLDIQRKTSNAIYLQLTVNGASVIASTSASATLADSVFGRAELTYDGTNYQMIWNGANIGSATAGNAPTTPSKGLLATASTVVVDKWDYIPSVTFTDPFTADTEARYHQLQNPAGAGAADIVVGGGVMTIAGTGGNEYSLYAVLKSYNFVSGEYEIAFKNNGGGGGGADAICVFFGQLDVQNTYRLTVNDNGTGSAVDLRLYYLFNNYSTQIGSTKDIRGRYVRGNKTWVKIQWDAIAGRFWIYLRDDAGVYPTTPDISDAFSTLFSAGKFGFGQIVSTAGAGNLNVSFYPPTVRAHCLIGETNVPTTETGYYFRDEYTTNSIGRYTTTGTWAVSGGVLSCSGAGNCKMPFGTDIGVHTFTPTFANGTDYYYFGGYRLKFVASGGNTCVITLETAAGVAQGSGSLTVTTTAGAFVNPVIINQAATSITVMCSGATGAIISGTTVVTAGVPYFSVGTATCTFDNYSFSGSRAYNKPMLRGAQIGEYWNGTQSVYCTRFVDDHCWDTSAEYTVPSGSLAADTANGRFSLTSGALGYVEYYPTGLLFSTNTLISCDFWLNNMDLIDIVFPVGGYSFYIEIDSAKIRLMSTSGGQIVSYVATVSTTRFHSLTIDAGTTGTIKVYWNGLLIINSSSNTSTIAQTYPKISCYGSVGDIAYIRNLRITGIESSSKNGVNLTLGGIPHGARYDVQEYGLNTFTNRAYYGTYKLVDAAKCTATATTNVELYYANSTDSATISTASTYTLTFTTTGTITDFVNDIQLLSKDRNDTITLQARRQTATTDNSSAVFVEYNALIPVTEVATV